MSAGAYLSSGNNPFLGAPDQTGLDIQIGVEIVDEGRRCILHLRGDTDAGRTLTSYLAKLTTWGHFVQIRVNN